MNKQQEPRLRFKGFTGAWEYKKFENVLSIKSGMSQKEIEVSDGIYPILATGGEIGRTNTALYDKESVLIGRKGTIDKPYYMNTPFWTVDTLFYSELKNNIDGKFLYFLFQCIEWRKLDTSTGVPSLTSTTIHEIQRYFPSKPEQTHLGLFFRRLDSQIAESRAVLEKSRQLKKAMLTKMFPASGEKIPKIRFKGFEGEWESRKLGEVVEIVGGYAFKSAEFGSGNMAIIRISNILPNGSIGGDFVYFGEDENLEKFKANKNDYLIAMSGATTGKIGQVRHEAYINQRVGLFRQNENSNNDFIGSLLQKEEFLTYLMENWGAGAQPNISIKQMENYNTYFPNLKEQTAIGLFFRQLDETIALQSAEVEKLNQLKKGLLAAMLV